MSLYLCVDCQYAFFILAGFIGSILWLVWLIIVGVKIIQNRGNHLV
ncbi:hypothetical protein [Emticicia sp. SJ17W-69]